MSFISHSLHKKKMNEGKIGLTKDTLTHRGKFAEYCQDCNLTSASYSGPTTENHPRSQTELACTCTPLTGDAGPSVATLNLGMFPFFLSLMLRSSLDVEKRLTTMFDVTDEGVENRNGTLVCRGGMGSGIGPGPFSEPPKVTLD